MIRRLALSLLPLALLGGCAMDQNYALNSVHKPVVRGGKATVPGCPDWSDGQTEPSAGATARNYGCATASNLAAMVADPADLFHGRAADIWSDPATGMKAIKTWREAKPTGEKGLKAETVQSGGSR